MKFLKFLAISSVNAALIKKCTQPGLLSLCFEEGPYDQSNLTMDYLVSKNIKASFHFIQSQMNTPIGLAIAKRAVIEGHVVGYRVEPTWNLTALTTAEFQTKMTAVSKFYKDNLNVNLKYIRLPYRNGEFPTLVPVLEQMGYIVTQHNLDSEDYNSTSNVLRMFKNSLDFGNVAADSWISIQLESLTSSVNQIPEIVDYIESKNYRIVPLDQCIGQTPLSPLQSGSLSSKKNGISIIVTSDSTSTVTTTKTPTSVPNTNSSIRTESGLYIASFFIVVSMFLVYL